MWSTVLALRRALDLIMMSDFNEAMDHLVMANSVCFYCHVLSWTDGDVLKTWKRLVVADWMNVGLSKEDALCQSRCIFSINQIATRLM